METDILKEKQATLYQIAFRQTAALSAEKVK